MPKIHYEIVIKRDYIVSVIEKMVESARAITEKQALRIIYNRSKKRFIETGFNNEVDFPKFYNNYRNHKRKTKK